MQIKFQRYAAVAFRFVGFPLACLVTVLFLMNMAIQILARGPELVAYGLIGIMAGILLIPILLILAVSAVAIAVLMTVVGWENAK